MTVKKKEKNVQIEKKNQGIQDDIVRFRNLTSGNINTLLGSYKNQPAGRMMITIEPNKSTHARKCTCAYMFMSAHFLFASIFLYRVNDSKGVKEI